MLHNTILKYIALIKSVFNSLKVTHKDVNGRLISKNIPMIYGRKEKALVVENYTDEQMLKGNVHVIPCGYISLDAFSKDDSRQTNKNRTFKFREDGAARFSYNSVPYDFVFSIMVRCRGVTEAYQIVEQVAPMFNPTMNLDVWDALYLDEPTRVPLILDGLDVEAPEYEENSNNIYTVSLSLTLKGWIYQPIMTSELIRNTLVNVAVDDNDAYASVIDDDIILDADRLKLNIIDIQQIGKSLMAIIDADPSLVVKYDWDAPGLDIKGDGKTVEVNAEEEFSVELTITDQFGNFESMVKKFKPAVYV